MDKIRIGIIGYGNLGRGVELALAQNNDLELAGIFTRRSPELLNVLTKGVTHSVNQVLEFQNKVDVMILCGGSATDLPEQGVIYAKHFNTIDSFDTHAKIPEYFDSMDKAAKASGHISIISVGWDPGLFSLNRLYAESVLTNGSTYTFWGKGVSQGHSDAIRRIKGVKLGIQYTVPVEDAIKQVRSHQQPDLNTRQKHTRECYVVAEEGADLSSIEAEIKNMPNYFADYDTSVTFLTEEEFRTQHTAMPHGGFVMRSGRTGVEESTNQMIEYSLKLDSNPEFTASVLVAYARAAHRLAKEGARGARTVLDIPPAYLSAKSGARLRNELL